MLFTGISKLLQLIINALAAVLGTAAHVFPPSPFKFVMSGIPQNVLSSINYFVPLAEIILFLEGWIIAVAGYYTISVVARYLKAID